MKSSFPPGDIRQKGPFRAALELPRIALVETYFHDMDAGWTRFLFDSYHMPFTVLHPGDFAESDLAAEI